MDEQIDLANVHFQNQNYGLAIKIYDGLIRQNDQNYSLYVNRSAALYKLNKFKESLEDAMRAIQLNPKSVKAHFREGMALRSLQKPIDAIVAFSKGLVIEKNNSQMLSNLIATLESTKFWSSIGPTLSQLRSIEPKLEPFLVISLVGQHILTLNHYLESSILLDCCLQIDTDSLKLKSSVHASLAVAYWKLDNKFDLAINEMRQDLNCVIKLNDLNGQYRSLSNLALAYYQLQQFDDSLASYLAQLDVAKLLEDNFKVLESLKSIAGVHQQMKDYRKAISTYEELLNLANQEDNLSLVLKALKSLSYLNLQLNDLQKAINYQEQVCRLVEKVPNFSRIKPKACLELSDLYEQIGNHQKSCEILNKLMNACDDGVDQKKFELLLLEKTSDVNFKLKNYELSIEMNEKLLAKLDRQDEETGRRAKILNQLAECHFGLGDHMKSIKYFKQQLKLVDEESANTTTKFQRLDAMKKLSVCYKKTNQLDDTLKSYFDVLNYSREAADLESQLWSFFNIGFCYYTNGVYSEAISIFLEYLALLDEADSGADDEQTKKERLKIYHVLALIHFKMSDFKQAFGYFRRDSDLMEQLKEQLADLNPNIDLDQLTNSEGNELLVCTKICCLLISPKASSTVDDILNSFAELSIS